MNYNKILLIVASLLIFTGCSKEDANTCSYMQLESAVTNSNLIIVATLKQKKEMNVKDGVYDMIGEFADLSVLYGSLQKTSISVSYAYGNKFDIPPYKGEKVIVFLNVVKGGRSCVKIIAATKENIAKTKIEIKTKGKEENNKKLSQPFRHQ